jgi:hypothetical protein
LSFTGSPEENVVDADDNVIDNTTRGNDVHEPT